MKISDSAHAAGLHSGSRRARRTVRAPRVVPTCLCAALIAALFLPAIAQAQGILLLAHGGREDWNREVLELASKVDAERPVEVAFGMANKRAIQDAVNRLAEREVTGIVAVPLFISSHSSVIRATEYLLGKRDDAPDDVQAKATQELRSVVERGAQKGKSVLIVPLLLSYGGIEKGIRERMEGLDYRMASQGLLPDGRLAGWVLAQAGER